MSGFLSDYSSAVGMPARTAAQLRGYKHVEAFALMLYVCRSCAHREVIWNSRDGVTPFGTACPSCGRPDLLHDAFGSDWCVPDHKPHFGQRVWVSMTLARATEIAIARVKMVAPERLKQVDTMQSLFNSIYQDGDGPDLAITGYTEAPRG